MLLVHLRDPFLADKADQAKEKGQAQEHLKYLMSRWNDTGSQSTRTDNRVEEQD